VDVLKVFSGEAALRSRTRGVLSLATRLRDELDDLRAPIDVVVVSEDVARRRAVV
jgi:hypothetical protein